LKAARRFTPAGFSIAVFYLDQPRSGESAGFTPAGFIASFLTKFAQSQFANWCEYQAVIGPDTDDGFSIPRRKSNGSAYGACFKRRREHSNALRWSCARRREGPRTM
jgi:hypothetical protein